MAVVAKWNINAVLFATVPFNVAVVELQIVQKWLYV